MSHQTLPVSVVCVEDLVGAWRLQAAYSVDDAGQPLHHVFGPKPSGYLHYESSGQVMVLITHDGRQVLDGDMQTAPAEQRAAAYSTSIAYAGRYVLQGDQVRHCIEVSMHPNWVGTELARTVSVTGDTLVLQTAPQAQSGVAEAIKLVWCRAQG